MITKAYLNSMDRLDTAYNLIRAEIDNLDCLRNYEPNEFTENLAIAYDDLLKAARLLVHAAGKQFLNKVQEDERNE